MLEREQPAQEVQDEEAARKQRAIQFVRNAPFVRGIEKVLTKTNNKCLGGLGIVDVVVPEEDPYNVSFSLRWGPKDEDGKMPFKLEIFRYEYNPSYLEIKANYSANPSKEFHVSALMTPLNVRIIRGIIKTEHTAIRATARAA